MDRVYNNSTNNSNGMNNGNGMNSSNGINSSNGMNNGNGMNNSNGMNSGNGNSMNNGNGINNGMNNGNGNNIDLSSLMAKLQQIEEGNDLNNDKRIAYGGKRSADIDTMSNVDSVLDGSDDEKVDISKLLDENKDNVSKYKKIKNINANYVLINKKQWAEIPPSIYIRYIDKDGDWIPGGTIKKNGNGMIVLTSYNKITRKKSNISVDYKNILELFIYDVDKKTKKEVKKKKERNISDTESDIVSVSSKKNDYNNLNNIFSENIEMVNEIDKLKEKSVLFENEIIDLRKIVEEQKEYINKLMLNAKHIGNVLHKAKII